MYNTIRGGTMKLETTYDNQRRLGRLEVFDESGRCIASRIVHSVREIKAVLDDLATVIQLSGLQTDEIINQYQKAGLPENPGR